MKQIMIRLAAAALLLPLTGAAPPPPVPASEQARWRGEAARVSIVRDDWGIAHVHGHSDADAVFGAIYAQAEDDFPRVEANLLTALGRTAEAEGEAAIWQDLRQRLYIDPDVLKADYAQSPPWLRALMDAWADGLNFYLATHPDSHARVLARFEPWMALSFTEGSIGGDIERADLGKLAKLYGGVPEYHFASRTLPDSEPRGSNGIAIAPRLTRDGRALLLINPHTSFFFRSELGMSSDAGLHAYGASTWGQFFIYQGFNERVGWMHTSSGVDAVDEFAETIAPHDGTLSYRFGTGFRPVKLTNITLRYRLPNGALAARTFATLATHHGPIVRKDGDTYIALALMNRPIPALEQSWLRTRATSYAEYLKVAALQANSSNDTIYADADGTIAYLHPQFVPKRDDRFDYRAPVDGSDPATDWHGLHALSELPAVRDPAGGWLYNTNNWPWSAAGADSPKAAAYPRYMDMAGENPRGVHAVRLLGKAQGLTPEGLMQLAYDPQMPAFDRLLPKLFAAYDALPAADPRHAKLAPAIALLRGWDTRWSAASEPTTIAAFFGDALWSVAEAPSHAARMTIWDWMDARATPAQYLAALAAGTDRLMTDWGTIHVAWGQVNRFQRNDAAITQTFDDAKPSIPVPFASAKWGSLASFGAHAYPGTRRWYGTNGNSFVAVVAFGPRTQAWAVTAGGESGHPGSPHFTDEAARYAAGRLRPVYFYPEDLTGHTERSYHPGG